MEGELLYYIEAAPSTFFYGLPRRKLLTLPAEYTSAKGSRKITFFFLYMSSRKEKKINK